MKTTPYTSAKKKSTSINKVHFKTKQNKANNKGIGPIKKIKDVEHVENGISKDKHIGGLKMFPGTSIRIKSGKKGKQSCNDNEANVQTETSKSNIHNEKNSKISSKLQHYDATEIMRKFENFSDVWNDCPDIKNPKKQENNISRSSDSQSTKPYHIEQVGKHFKTNSEKSKNRLPNKSYRDETDNVMLSNSQSKHTNESLNKSTNAPLQNHKKNSSNTTLTNENHNVGDALKIQSNLKRQRAAEKKGRQYSDQKNIIKQALSALDGEGKVNKKIVFSDNEEVEQRPKTKQSKQVHQLFNDEEDSEPEVNLKLNPQFQGKKGQKLLELQSKFANDSRFNLDTRFYESGSEESIDEEEVNSEQTDEKKRQLAILESIVQREIKPLSEIKRKSGHKDTATLLLRFDPTREDHSKYIVNRPDKKPGANIDENVKKKKRKKDKLEEIKSAEQNPPPKVSNEKIFKIKEDFKESLKQETGKEFSLLKLFGSKEPEEDGAQEKNSETITKPKYGTKNPFKYDSSESEEEKEETKSKETLSKRAVVSWQPTFFFSEGDSRFQEGLEFLQGPKVSEDTEEYAEKRKQLKDFIRHKLKNYNRKKTLFKTKLGGLKKKGFPKKKAKQSGAS